MSVQGWQGQLPAGARFSQGFHLEYDPQIPHDYITAELEGCLYGSGGFTELEITQPVVSPFHEYWQIDGRTSETFGDPQDLQNLIRGTIQSCAVTVNIIGEFPLTINSVPDPRQGVDVGTKLPPQITPGAAAGSAPGGQAKPSACNWSQMTFGNYLACQLGLTPTSSGAIGLVAGVLGAILILKALK